MSTAKAGAIRVLHVDDEPDFGEMAAMFLEREHDSFDVVTATSAQEGLKHITGESASIDSVVSDYDMPGMDGLEFLETVREEHPDLPFVLFTGRGSEEIASEAISLGVTDYLQKEVGTEQYEVLANRIKNAVEAHRAERQLERYETAIKAAPVGVFVLDNEGTIEWSNERAGSFVGQAARELIDEPFVSLVEKGTVSECAITKYTETVRELLSSENDQVTGNYEIMVTPPERGETQLQVHVSPLPYDEEFEGTVLVAEDITEAHQRQ